jgi:sensitive to high expression protein 9
LRLRALPPPLPERVLSAVTPAASEHSSPTSSESTPSISSDAAETIGSSSASSSASSSPSPSSTSVPDESEQRVEEWKQQLHKHYAYRKQEFDCWSRELGDKTSKNLSLLGRKINEVTGYREVERLKQAVKDRGEHQSTERTDD